MDIDPRQVIGIIVIGAAAGTFVLSYVAAYLIGRGHGRRDAELAQRELAHHAGHERFAAVEGAVSTVAQSMARLADAQRLLVAQQDEMAQRLRRADQAALPQRRPGMGPVPGRDTPA